MSPASDRTNPRLESKSVGKLFNDRLFTCTLCQETFPESDVILHLHIQPHVTLYDCDSCIEGFPSEDLLKKHLLYHTEMMIHQNYLSNGGWLLLVDVGTEMKNTDSPHTKVLQEAIQQRQRTLYLTVEHSCSISAKSYFHKENHLLYMTELSNGKERGVCIGPSTVGTSQSSEGDETVENRPKSQSSCGDETMGNVHNRSAGKGCPIRMSTKPLRENCGDDLRSTSNVVISAVVVGTSTTEVCDAERAKKTKNTCVEHNEADIDDKVKEAGPEKTSSLSGQIASVSLTYLEVLSDTGQNNPQHDATVVSQSIPCAEGLNVETSSQRQIASSDIVGSVPSSAAKITHTGIQDIEHQRTREEEQRRAKAMRRQRNQRYPAIKRALETGNCFQDETTGNMSNGCNKEDSMMRTKGFRKDYRDDLHPRSSDIKSAIVGSLKTVGVPDTCTQIHVCDSSALNACSSDIFYLMKRHILSNENVESAEGSAAKMTESVESYETEVAETPSMDRGGFMASTTIFDTGIQHEKRTREEEKRRAKAMRRERNLRYRAKKRGLEIVDCTADKPHSCSQCSKQFSFASNLEHHMKDHVREKAHKCSKCDKQFARPSQFKLHMMTHTGEKPHECSQCAKRFRTTSKLREHMMTHTRQKSKAEVRQKCLHCGQELIHNMSSLVLRPSLCDVCLETRSREEEKRTAKAIKKRMRNQRYYAKKRGLEIVDCTGEKPHTCSQCDKQFTQAGNLKAHMMTHTGEKPHTCCKCGKQFRLASHLKSHIIIHTGDFLCSQCGKQFIRASHLKTHMMAHTGEKPHKCSQCGKQFRVTSTLREHMMTHTGKETYTCSVCSKGFGQAGNLKTHMMTHAVQDTHKCSQCGKQFTTAHRLKQHMLMHLRQKCLHCGQEFKDNMGLRTHMIIHTGQNYSSCATCVNGFTQTSDLLDHLATHIIVPALQFTYNSQFKVAFSPTVYT